MAFFPPHLSLVERSWYIAFRIICACVLFFLIFPIFVIVPLSFNALPYFTFTPEMLAFKAVGYSTQWYKEFFTDPNWQGAVKNSVIIALASTSIAVGLGTLAALGLSRKDMPARSLIMGLLISPMIVPLIISAIGMFFFYSRLGMQGTHIAVILAHAALGTPFVVITVTATLVGFDLTLLRAAASLGANPTIAFFRITLPIILPGVISGGLFAFITSFDEVVVVLFVGSFKQRTIPWKMFSGIREHISPTILAVATCLIIVSIALLMSLEILRRRGEKLRGVKHS